MTRSHERAQFLSDVIITAVEGGTNYWAAVSQYVWSFEDPATTYAVLHEEDPDDPSGYAAEGHRIGVDDIARALGRIRGPEAIAYLGDHMRDHIRTVDRDNGEHSDWDADTADVIVQVAIFGEVVYG